MVSLATDLEGFFNHQRADTGEKPRLVTFVDAPFGAGRNRQD